MNRTTAAPALAPAFVAAPAAALVGALAAALLAAPALADEVTGTVVAHDRVAHRVIMDDRTIYEYDPAGTELPRAILAGDTIRITYRGGEDGIEAIQRIEIVEAGGSTDAAPTGDATGSDDTGASDG